jgi:sugar phosphate isomerase/epimerase
MKFSFHTISWALIRFQYLDIEKIFDMIKDAGFTGVEGVNINDEKNLIEIVSIAKEKGLSIVSISSSDINNGIKFSSVIGCEFYQTGGWYRDKLITGNLKEDLKLCVNEFEEIGKYAKKYGVKIAVHPHLNQIIENLEEIEFLMENSENIYLLIDTAHQFAANVNPVELFLKYKERVAHIHLKDVRGKEFVPLGEGEVEIEKFLDTLKENEYRNWVGVELDRKIEWLKEKNFLSTVEKNIKKISSFLKKNGYLK